MLLVLLKNSLVDQLHPVGAAVVIVEDSDQDEDEHRHEHDVGAVDDDLDDRGFS